MHKTFATGSYAAITLQNHSNFTNHTVCASVWLFLGRGVTILSFTKRIFKIELMNVLLNGNGIIKYCNTLIAFNSIKRERGNLSFKIKRNTFTSETSVL